MEKDSINPNSLAFSFLDETDENGFLNKFQNRKLFICKDSMNFNCSEKQNLEPICVNSYDIAYSKNDENVEFLDFQKKSLPLDLDLTQTQSNDSCLYINGEKKVNAINPFDKNNSTREFQVNINNNFCSTYNNQNSKTNNNDNCNNKVSDENCQKKNEFDYKKEKEEEENFNEKAKKIEDMNVELNINVQTTLSFDRNVVSQFEKKSLPEFFSGKYDRTHFYPNQYLLIRNLFLDEWESRKPQPICFRDLIRLNPGIGNVVSFSRVCKFLTAIGAINNKEQMKVTLTGNKEKITLNEKISKPVKEKINKCKFSSHEFKKTRKRKSYYLNEMSRLGIDPITCGFTIPQSEIENVISVFTNKKPNGYGFNQISHLSTVSTTQTTSTKLQDDFTQSQFEISNNNNNNNCETKPIEEKLFSNVIPDENFKRDFLSIDNISIRNLTGNETIPNEPPKLSSLTDSSNLSENSKTQSQSIELLNKQIHSFESSINTINDSVDIKILDSTQNFLNLNNDHKPELKNSENANLTKFKTLKSTSPNQEFINTTKSNNFSNFTMTRSISGLSNCDVLKNSRTRPNPFKLIPCENYGCNVEAPFSLCLSVEALIIIDVHSHCVQTEVIGLLGGLFCSTYRQLNILTAEPCESLTASTTDLQCEMDPVSQADASERLAKSGYQVVGWYHSHPTFVPNPSLRDLETQAKYQELFAEGNKPFLALILNPYCTTNQSSKTSPVSKYKCLMLSDQSKFQVDYQTPYAFTPILVRKDRLFFNLSVRLKELCSKIEGKPSTLCITNKLKGKDTQYLQKLILSLKHHLELTGLSNKERDILLQQIKEILLSHLQNKSSIK